MPFRGDVYLQEWFARSMEDEEATAQGLAFLVDALLLSDGASRLLIGLEEALPMTVSQKK